MNNLNLANKLKALFPIDDIGIRVALVSVLKSVLKAGTNGPRQRFAFSEDGVEYMPFFIKELLAQPLLMGVLFPGKSPSDVRQEFSGLTPDGSHMMSEIYSMLSKKILLDDMWIYKSRFKTNLLGLNQNLLQVYVKLSKLPLEFDEHAHESS